MAVLVLGFAAALVQCLPILQLLLQLFQRRPLPTLLATSAVLASAAGLFAPQLECIRRDVPGARRALLLTGALALLASVFVARALEWRQGASWP